jgi:hypothetical protein
MRLLFFALDSASGDAGRRLAAGLTARGHTCFASVYNRDEALETRLKAGFAQAGAEVVETRAMRPLPLRRFFMDGRLRREAPVHRILAALAAAGVFWCARRLGIDRLPGFRRVLGRGPQTALRTWAGLVADKAEAVRLLAASGADAVVLHHDYAGHFSTTLAVIARREGVPVVVVPALYPEPELLVRALARRPQNLALTPPARATARRHPAWRAEAEGLTVLRYEWWRIRLLAALGLSPEQPFVHQTCPSDAILLPDAALAARYAELGFDPARLKITGSVVQDELARARPPHGAARIVVAVPPDQSGAGERVDGGYEGLLARLIAICGDLRGSPRIIASVHPKQDEAALAPLAGAGFTVSREPLSGLLPGAAAMLGYVGSSTLRWGAWSAIPVIAWDAYGYEPGRERRALSALGPVRPWLQLLDAVDVRSALADAVSPGGAEAWQAAYRRLGIVPPDGRALDRIEAEIAAVTGRTVR